MRFFALKGRHFAPMGEIWRSPPPCHISPHWCNDKGIVPPKLKFLLRFDQNVEYKRSAVAYPLGDFHKIRVVCTPFQDVLAVKIWWICSRGYGVMGVLS